MKHLKPNRCTSFSFTLDTLLSWTLGIWRISTLVLYKYKTGEMKPACAGRPGRSSPRSRWPPPPLPGWRGRPTGRQFPAPERRRLHAHSALKSRLWPDSEKRRQRWRDGWFPAIIGTCNMTFLGKGHKRTIFYLDEKLWWRCARFHSAYRFLHTPVEDLGHWPGTRSLKLTGRTFPHSAAHY